MKKSQDPIVQRKVDLEENPKGTCSKYLSKEIWKKTEDMFQFREIKITQ